MKDKIIEEMARDMDYGCIKRDLYPDDAKEIAKALYLLGYRKIPEGGVVLTRKEYERLCDLAYFGNGEETVRKETAEKFAEKVSQAIVDNTYPYFDKDGKPVNIWKAVLGFDKIDEICKEFTGDRDEKG